MAQIRLKIPKIEAKDSKDIFVLFAALNIVGYNDENNSNGMSPMRKKVRSILKQHKIRTQYPAIASALKQHHPWYLLHKILVAKSDYLYQSFLSSVEKFSREQAVENLWEITKVDRIKEIQKITPLFEQEVTQLIKFFNKTPPDLEKIILVANLLDAYWRGYSVRIKSTGYIIIGPGATKNGGELIRHELLHLLAPSFKLSRPLIENCSLSATDGYANNQIKNRECVVCALNLLYEKQVLRMNIKTAVRREKKRFPCIEKIMIYLKDKVKRGHTK